MKNINTKIRKNYLALAMMIAVLGVISVALISINSYADTTNSNKIHLTGKALDPDNVAVAYGRAYVEVQEFISDESGEYTRLVEYDGTTSSTGEFDIEITISPDARTSSIFEYGVQQDGTSSQRRLWYYNHPFTLISDSDIDVGTFVCPYFVKLETLINGVDRTEMRDYGTWYWNEGPMAFEENGGGPGYFYYYATYTINNDTVTINSDETSVQPAREDTFRFEVNSEHEFLYIEVEQDVGTNSTAAITGGTINLNAVVDNPGPVPPTPTLHTVTFGENISSVYANGVEITSGTEVEEGTNLLIIPAVADKKVTKVYVNGSVCPSCQAIVNSNVDIEGKMYDSVKLSGRVSTGDKEKQDALKAISNIFVDKAYASESGVEGAIVTFTDATDGWYTSTVSDSNGDFELDVVQGNAGILSVFKDGYEEYLIEIDADDLEDDYIINPVLKATSDNPEINPSIASTAQTGDNTQYIVLLFIIAGSCAVLFRSYRKVNGVHKK